MPDLRDHPTCCLCGDPIMGRSHLLDSYEHLCDECADTPRGQELLSDD